MKTAFTALALACSLAVSGQALAARTPVPAPDRTIALSGSQSADRVKTAILSAAAVRKFAVVSTANGRITLAYPANPRKFQARFDVIYDSNHVTMRLKDSLGLNQWPCPGNPGVACIHPNVPRWMKNHLADVENLLR